MTKNRKYINYKVSEGEENGIYNYYINYYINYYRDAINTNTNIKIQNSNMDITKRIIYIIY